MKSGYDVIPRSSCRRVFFSINSYTILRKTYAKKSIVLGFIKSGL